MLREMRIDDIESVMKIWFSSTITAHPFISVEYWEQNYDTVKNIYLPNAKTSVFEEAGIIKGFISIIDESFIGALFVDNKFQGYGIGSALIEDALNNYKHLSLAVYKDNLKSVKFYKQRGFKICCEQVDEDTGKLEIIMQK